MCEICNGSNQIIDVGPETGHSFIMQRHLDTETGKLTDYFDVVEKDENGHIIHETFTPDASYCPFCGEML